MTPPRSNLARHLMRQLRASKATEAALLLLLKEALEEAEARDEQDAESKDYRRRLKAGIRRAEKHEDVGEGRE